MAHTLDGYLWAVSSVTAENLQIQCVQDIYIITIKPPLQILDVGNGYEASSPNIYIPAKSELTTTLQSLPHSEFFQKFNLKYKNISTFVVFCNVNMATLTSDQVAKLKAKISHLKPMNIELLEQ